MEEREGRGVGENELPGPHEAFLSHPRRFRGSRVVYPVLSRRSGGISIGVNLSPGQRCNFNCLYCQVDRTGAAGQEGVDLAVLEEELREAVRLVLSGELFGYEPFDTVPGELRFLRDIALSGDGEPTAAGEFPAACRVVLKVKRELGLSDVGVVVITNATRLDRPEVEAALAELDGEGLAVWGKLDAGTEEYFRLVNGSAVSFGRVLANLRETGRRRPLVIQTLLARIDGVGPGEGEIEAYVERLEELKAAGARLAGVQVYTIARRPREARVAALGREELEAVAAKVRRRVGVEAKVYA